MASFDAATELEVFRISYPIVLLLSFFAAFIVTSIQLANEANQDVDRGASQGAHGPGGKALPKRLRSAMNELRSAQQKLPRQDRLVFAGLTALILGTFLADGAAHIIHILVAKSQNWWCGQAVVIYVVGAFFTHAIILVSVLDTTPSPTLAQLIPWVIAAAFELAILGTSLSIYTGAHREPVIGDPFGGPLRDNITTWESLEVLFCSLRVLILALLVTLYVLRSVRQKRHAKLSESINSAESTGLLHSSNTHGDSEEDGYGSIEGPRETKSAKVDEPWVRPLTTPTTSWWEYLSGYSLFFPYLWPSKSRRLRFVVVLCFGLLLIQRVVNVLVPYQVGIITDRLSFEENEDGSQQLQVPWLQICLYILYRYLQGSQGLIESLRSNLWISVSQYSYMELSTGAFEHVHNLGLDFHLGKKIGEVLSALTKGSSINTFLEQVTFQMVPMLADLAVAFAYFLIAFDAYYALVVAIVTFWYLYVTVRIAQWRAEMRRQMVNASRQEDAVKTDSLISYETVKYFNAEDYEFQRYRGAVANFQDSEYHSLVAQNLMNTAQNTVFMMGLMVTCFIAAYQIASGQRKVGKFMTLLTYMAQLQTPLSFFGTFYRYMQSALINSERLLELFKVQASITDKATAKPLTVCNGAITFEDVKFAYDNRKPALNGLTFTCEPGTTTALVGESGGGKSTVFRLIFRFYQAERGRIMIDGNDVQDLTISSLRKHIGVVPQDPVLFNESLMFNMRYANQEATDEDIYAACRAASIHEKIMSFPDGYETKVGDRGMRLSGGEKQRVAIARTILKNPKIILLDEATAALDSETEQHIQEALAALSKGRTVLIIAHRLSTITTADNILVLSEGVVAESGTHESLMARDGKYTTMWKKQIRAQRKAVDQEVRRNEELKRRVSSAGPGSTGTSTAVEDSASSSGTEENDAESSHSREDREQWRAS